MTYLFGSSGAASPTESTLTYSATLSWNLTTDPATRVTLTGNTTITLSGGSNGGRYRLAVMQDATGGRTVTLAGCTVIGSPLWNTNASGINVITVEVVNGTRYVAVA